MKLEEVRDECARCYHLKPWSITMSGDHDYCCRKRPRAFLDKARKERCDQFKDFDEVFKAKEVIDFGSM